MKRIVNIALASIAAIACASQSLAQDGIQACAQVYQDATKEISIEVRRKAAASHYYSLYCESNGAVKSFAICGSVEIPIEGIPLGASSSSTFASTDIQQFCANTENRNASARDDFVYGSRPVVDSLNSFRQCMALWAGGLELGYEPGIDGFIISGRMRDQTSRATLDAVEYDESLMTCSSANFDQGGVRQVLHGTMRLEFPLGSNWTIACRRTKMERSGTLGWYPSAEFRMGTSFGAFSAQIPSDAFLDFDVASSAQQAFSAMVSERDAARAQVAQLERQMRCGQARVTRLRGMLDRSWADWKVIAETYANPQLRWALQNMFANDTRSTHPALRYVKRDYDGMLSSIDGYLLNRVSC